MIDGYDFRYNDDALIIYCTREKQMELLAFRTAEPDVFCTDRALSDELEEITCNSELDWIDPMDTGDLTDAPLLGVLGEGPPVVLEKIPPHLGEVCVDWTEEGELFLPIERRWGYAPYQIRSPLDDLADKGRAIFESRW